MISKPLASIAKIVAGQSPESSTYNSTGEGLPFFQGKADFQDMHPTVRMWSTSEKRKEVEPGDILISVRAPVGAVNICNQKSIIGRGLAAIRPSSELDGKFLYYWFKANERQIDALGTGSTFKAITQDTLKKIEVPVPPPDDQIRIAHLLSKVEELISQRKQHLQQLDDLLKSVFLEMFGDIRAKKSSHPWAALRPYLNANSGKSSKNVISEIDTGIPIFGGNGVNGWATKALYEVPVVVAGRVGQQCGVIHVSKGPCWVTDNAIVLSISDDSRLNIVYLAKALHYAPIRERVKQLDLPFISQPMLLDYPLPLPPISLQNRFTAIVEKIEALKSRYQQSLADLESLYGALSQQAFKGELDLSRIPMPKPPTQYITSASQGDQAAVPEPVVQTVPAIHLPDTDNLLAALENAAARKALIAEWLEAYRAQLAGTPFTTQSFMALAQTRLAELHSDNDFELDASDYEHIKAWVFEALAVGTLTQAFDDAGNRIELKAAVGETPA
jgi:type I restriction enzyme S subunit